MMRFLFLFAFCCAAAGADDFAQRAGFDSIRASLSDVLPTAAEIELLEQYRPVLYIGEDSAPPVDFYADYIAHGELRIGDEVFSAPSAAVLNEHKNNPAANFIYQGGDGGDTTPVAYGGIYTVGVDWPHVGQRQLTFLQYHFVFRHSGLPAGLSGLWKRLANVFADSSDWHQLDHYTAVFVVLDGGEPFAVILQQHNAMRTYFIGGEDFPALPVAVDAAISSNELYPHKAGRGEYPAVSFLSPGTVDYLLGLEPGGMFAAQDITDGRRRVDYALKFLPPNDAFYVFQGYLGEQRFLPGRSGPPGAIYRTLPELWHLEKSLYMFYWQPQDEEYAALVRQGKVWQNAEAMEKLKTRFAGEWARRVGPREAGGRGG